MPSPEGGISLFKLRVLDKLIDRLLAEGQSRARGRPAVRPGARAGRDPDRRAGRRGFTRLDSLAGLFGGFAPETGMLLDLLA